MKQLKQLRQLKQLKQRKRGRILCFVLAAALVLASFPNKAMEVNATGSSVSSVEDIVSSMSLKDKVTQMLMVDFRYWDEDTSDSTAQTAFTEMNDQVRKIIEDYNFGAVVYFAQNITETEQSYDLTMEMQKAATKDGGIAMIIAADQEGGSVYRLGTGTALPGNMALGATYAANGTAYAYEAGKIIGSELSALGINTTLAPVVDVNNNPNNPVIGLRSYGDDATVVGELASAAIAGLNEYDVIGCAKHFPGHGDTATDSHYGLPLVDKTLAELKEVELKPYEIAIEQGIDMIMTAHILYPELEDDKIVSDKTGEAESLPATMSDDILTGLLKGEMGFQGIVVTDGMNMAGISANWDRVQAVVIAISAGVDMICMPVHLYSNDDLESMDAVIQGVIDAVEAGEIPESRIDDAVTRILTVKEKHGLLSWSADHYSLETALKTVGSDENREMEREIAAAAVTVVRNDNNVLPMKITSDSKVLLLVPYNNERAQLLMAWNRGKEAGLIPDGAQVDYYRFSSATINTELQAKLDWADTYFIISEVSSAARMGYNHWLSAMPNKLCNYAEVNNKTAIVASCDKPYDVQLYPNADAVLAAYGCKGSSVDPTEALVGGVTSSTAAYGPNIIASLEVALGTYHAQGKLPVEIPVYDADASVYAAETAYERGYGLTYFSSVTCSKPHEYGDANILSEATCEADGIKTSQCKVCGYVLRETMPALGHKWDAGVITKEATPDSDGEKTYTCKSCNSTRTELVPYDIEVEPLTSITYKLNDATSGYANGVVTVTKDASNEAAIDCVMYWADKDGKPLEGYTSLAKFKLTGEKTTHQMYTHTIIPEGAKKLIAYASNGEILSPTAVSVTLPDNCAYKFDGNVNVEFQMISDTHVTTDSGATGYVKLANQHFTQMLEDVKANSKDSIGIFINGDVVNSGKNEEFQKLYDLYQTEVNEGDGDLPGLHIAIGNHDWMTGNPDAQFQKYAKIFNDSLAEQPENVYYDETVDGYHFIYLGSEQSGLRAVLSEKQIEWFDQRMAEISAKDPDQPVFVLLHQALYDTVAGTLSGQGWDGVVNESALKEVMKKYGQIIIMGGHSHWELNSESCMYPGDTSMPVAMNTASVGYLWSSYDIRSGEFAPGSHGYYVRVYDDKVVFLGRDFENNKFLPSAMFVLERNEIQTPTDVYNVSLDEEAVNLEAKATAGGSLEYVSANTAIASVTEDGTVIPKKEGEVDITITSFGTSTTVLSRKTVTVKVVDKSVYRIYGSTRYETSFETAEALRETLGVEQFETVIVASGTNFPDALAGSYLAAKKDAPILMTNDDSKNKAALYTYIENNVVSKGTVYILGGEAAVSASVESTLKEKGYKVIRLSGKDRYATNIAILNEAGVDKEDLLVCTGKDFADSLSSSATGLPILLVNNNGLTATQKTFLQSVKGNDIYIVGGTAAVSASYDSALKKYDTDGVDRLAGKNRSKTSVVVAETFSPKAASVVCAYAYNFPDGLCGGPLAYNMRAPLILTGSDMDKKPNETEQKAGAEVASNYVKENGIKTGIVLGGEAVLSDITVRTIFGISAN